MDKGVGSNSPNDFLQEIVADLLTGECVFFLGAGVPKEGANAPDFIAFAQELLVDVNRKMKQNGAEEFSLVSEDGTFVHGIKPSQVAELYHVYAQRGLVEPLSQKIRSKFQSIKGTGHTYNLIELLSNERAKTGANLIEYIYTTNWDNSLGTYLSPKAVPIYNVGLLSDHRSNRALIKIIHLHGHVLGDTFIICEKHILTGYTLQEPLFKYIESELIRKTIVFVGYSLQDENLETMLIYLNKLKIGKKYFAVMPKSISPERWKFFRIIWKDRGMQFLDYTADEFFQELLNHLKQIKSEASYSEILARHPDWSASDLVRREKQVRRIFSEIDVDMLKLII